MIRVWSDKERAGILDRLGPRGSTFAYEPTAQPERAVSMTMPVRVQSWDAKLALLPIFEMNLPEGALRERLVRRFAKATGTFDDFDLIGVVGRSQIGRLRYSALDQDLDDDVPFQSIDEVLRARRDGDLFKYLLDRFSTHSGLSGVQPKVMIRGRDGQISDPKVRKSPSIQSATHIVKFWDEAEFPELAANEYYCLEVARALGLSVPAFNLSDDGGAIVIERFDLIGDRYLGFEDFCVLNGLGTAEKYKGGYEARVFRRLREFSSPAQSTTSLRALFQLFALNCAIRNGDAHLKNFGMIYDEVNGPAGIAPVYDLVTTWAYIPDDPMALTLDGSTRWPDRAGLVRLAQTRSDLGKAEAERILENIADAMSSVAPKLKGYFSGREGGVGERMLAAWDVGVKDSLGLIGRSASIGNVIGKDAKTIASSDARLLECLRQRGGTITGTLKQISIDIDMPLGTLRDAVRRLRERQLIEQGKRSLILLVKEV